MRGPVDGAAIEPLRAGRGEAARSLLYPDDRAPAGRPGSLQWGL